MSESSGAVIAEPSEAGPRRRGAAPAVAAMAAIAWRDVARLRRQPGRVVTNLAVPAAMQIALASGFGLTFGRPLLEPYDAYVALTDYMVPGMVALVLLVSCARSALAMTGPGGPESLRPLLTTPVPVPVLLLGKLIGAAMVATVQAYLFVLFAAAIGASLWPSGWLAAVPAVFVGAFVLTATLTIVVVAWRFMRSLARLTLLIVFPALVFSSAFYPLWQFTTNDAGYLETLATINPLTHVIELIRYASENLLLASSLVVVAATGIAAFAVAALLVDPRRRLYAWRPGVRTADEG